MEINLLTVGISILIGLLAGVINTFAGNGSALTLGLLTEYFGLPIDIANGTNRVGILMQGATSTWSFAKNDKLDWKKSQWPIIIAFIGAVIGAIIAIYIDKEFFRQIYQYLLILMLILILINPKRWISEQVGLFIDKPYALPLFFLLGLYGGFIQMGMGLLFLVVTVLILRYNFVRASALKTAIVFSYTVVVLAIFHFSGLVDWKLGLMIGIGQAIGGYFAAEFLSKYSKAQFVAYVILIIMVILVILSTFDIIKFK